jgi:hypothetical protein
LVRLVGWFSSLSREVTECSIVKRISWIVNQWQKSKWACTHLYTLLGHLASFLVLCQDLLRHGYPKRQLILESPWHSFEGVHDSGCIRVARVAVPEKVP